ncbi:Heterokaryon incompatibility protein (HET) domain containing protein [Rhypophila decipiens]
MFAYTELSHNVEVPFRLLYLAAGAEDSEIECLLVESDLASAGNTFEALSYVWGDTSVGKKTIKVDGLPFNVGANLYSALLYLRPKDEYRILWVDAICINQEDILERTSQVGHMRDIYKTARQTIAWLGEANEKTEKMFEGLQLLGNEALEMRAASKAPVSEKGDAYQHVLLKLDGADTFEGILENSWWRRVWTLQEMILARRATIHIGHHQIDWDFFTMAIQHAKAVNIFSNSFFGTAMTSATEPVDVVVSMKNAAPNVNPGTGFLSHAFFSHGRAATDPKDKLFGLLGLMTSDIGIRVDYNASPADVFIRSTRALIETAGNLHVLGFCFPFRVGALPVTEKERPLPSWVPQWGSTGTFATPMMFLANNTLRTSDASGGSVCAPKWTEDGTTLMVEGFVVDTVKTLSSVLPSLYLNNKHEGSFDWMDELEKKAFTNHDDDPDYDPSVWESIREVATAAKYLGKLISGVVSQLLGTFIDLSRYIEWEDFCRKEMTSRKAGTDTCDKIMCEILSVGTQFPGGPAETAEQFAQWRKSMWYIRKMKASKLDRVSKGLFQASSFIMGLKTEITKQNNAFTFMLRHCQERRMGVTQLGRMALFPKMTEQGDQVVILKGGRVPLVLRAKGNGYVELVGEAYVHGIMDGEAVNEHVRWSDFLLI